MSDSFNIGGDNDDLSFEFRKKPVSGELQQANWKAIEHAIHQREAPVRKKTLKRAGMIAVAIGTVIAAIWTIRDKTPASTLSQVNTAFGEIKHVMLPDSSKVILNANSSIRIPKDWTNEGDRQVWLEGEAYFDVTKKPAIRQKFIVHTAQVDVEVLGTKFNVNTRRQHSIISLEEGKIQLLMHEKIKSVSERFVRRTHIKPGQVAIIDQEDHLLVRDDKAIANRSGWSRNEFHFDHTTLADVSRIIEEMYGYRVEAREDPSLMQRAVSGDLRAANLDEFLKVLEVTFKIKMTKESKTILVTKP